MCAAKEAVSVAVALGVVQGEDRARRIFDQLRQEGFGPSRIAIRLLGPEDLPSFPETYDPVGAAQFFGTAIASLPATGGNLVGNSTTVDTSLSAFAEILSAMAERERHPLEADHPPETRLLVQVWGDGAERAAAILREAGAASVRLVWTGPLQDLELSAPLDEAVSDPFEDPFEGDLDGDRPEAKG